MHHMVCRLDVLLAYLPLLLVLSFDALAMDALKFALTERETPLTTA